MNAKPINAEPPLYTGRGMYPSYDAAGVRTGYAYTSHGAKLFGAAPAMLAVLEEIQNALAASQGLAVAIEPGTILADRIKRAVEAARE